MISLLSRGVFFNKVVRKQNLLESHVFYDF